MGDRRVSLTPCANFYRPVEELECTDLLRSTFTQPDQDKGFDTCRTRGTHPKCHFVPKRIGGGRVRWTVTWTPPLEKQQLVRKGLSQRVQNHNEQCVVRIEPVFWKCRTTIRVKIQCDKKTLIVETDISQKTEPDKVRNVNSQSHFCSGCQY
jgi:hypothetical protein